MRPLGRRTGPKAAKVQPDRHGPVHAEKRYAYSGAARSADPHPTLEALDPCFWGKIRVFLGCVFEAYTPPLRRVWANFSGRASIINTIGPSFFTSGHLNIPRVLERCWSLIYVVSRRKLGAQTGPMMLMMLALGGLLGA